MKEYEVVMRIQAAHDIEAVAMAGDLAAAHESVCALQINGHTIHVEPDGGVVIEKPNA
jgi:hypothetical protein